MLPLYSKKYEYDCKIYLGNEVYFLNFVLNKIKLAEKHMIIIQVKEGENIERALKRYKNKHRSVQITKQLRARKNYIKPTVANRAQKLKAVYINEKVLREDD